MRKIYKKKMCQPITHIDLIHSVRSKPCLRSFGEPVPLISLAKPFSKEVLFTLQTELSEVVPVVHGTVGGCRIIGRMTVGNRNGLLVPNSTTDQELQVKQIKTFVLGTLG